MRTKQQLMFAPIILSALGMPNLVFAQTATDVSDEQQADGADIIVTANRAPMRRDQIGQSVTVIDFKTIEAGQASGVAELIAQTAGVQFARNGGPGTTTSLYIRGAGNGQTVILYDGVRLHDSSAIDGGASLSDMMIGDIGRIEILRGSQSTLYGSQAIGGVINIIARKPAQAFGGNAQIEVGSLDTYAAKLGVGGAQGRLTWRVAGGYSASAGISAYVPGAEKDGYENITLGGNIGYAFSDDASLDLRSFYTDGDTDFDSFNGDALNRGKNKNWLNYVGLNFTLFDQLQNRISYGRTDITRMNLDASTPSVPVVTFDAAGKSDRFEYQGTLDITDGWMAVFGAEYAENEMSTLSPQYETSPTVGTDNTTGFYGQLQAEVVDGLTLTGGVRQEDHSTFGSSVVGTASFAWSLNGGGTVFRASWAQGFKAPSLYQLFSQYGNIALAPEKSDSWEIGFEQHLGEVLTLSAVYFQRDTANLIDFAYCPGNGLCDDGRFGYYENVGRASAKGAELEAALDFGALTATANYTFLDAKNTSAGDFNVGNRLARRAKHVFNAGVSYRWPFALVTAASVKVVGKAFNNGGNTQVIDAYEVFDIRMSYPVSDLVEAFGRVENLFDKNYETISNYGTLPRVAYAGFRLRF